MNRGRIVPLRLLEALEISASWSWSRRREFCHVEVRRYLENITMPFDTVGHFEMLMLGSARWNAC